jgi:hypothetical protein
MPQPRYINTQQQIIAPGVYVIENAPAIPIRGQRNRRAGFVGQCVRGPVNKVVMCPTYQRFIDIFGDRDKNTKGGAILGQVWKALQGKRWGAIGVVRAAASAAVAASFNLESAAGGAGVEYIHVVASSPGTWANDLGIKVTAASNGDANSWNLNVRLYGKVTVYQNLLTTTGNNNINVVIGNDDATLVRLSVIAAGRPINNAASTDGADIDGYVKLGQTVSGYTSVLGTDGSIADSDFTAANGPMDKINAYPGLHVLAVVGRSNTAIKSAISTYAATASQRVWALCPDDETVIQSTAVTERATFNSQRMSYWFNHCYIIDPFTREEIVEEPFLQPMQIITQTDPDVHVGDFDNALLTKAARRTAWELDSDDRDALTIGGVSFMLHDQDQSGNDVILPGHAVTCDFSNNNKDLDGRYMKDFILDAIAQKLRGSQFKGNTPTARAERGAAVSGFLDNLARIDRYILRDESGTPQFSYANGDSVNSPNDQATGLQKESLIARLIPKNIQILLLAVIGVDATISEQ